MKKILKEIANHPNYAFSNQTFFELHKRKL